MSGPGPADAERASDRLSSLDVLRFLAAAAVMVYHFTYRYANGSDAPLPALQAVTRHGYLGVDVFFIISGFVVLWSAKGRSATRFVRARLLRLYPEFWIAVLLTALIFTLVPGAFGESLTPAIVLKNLTMIPQYLGTPFVDGVYWTLGIEIRFYFLLWVLIVLGQLGRIEAWLHAWLALLVVASVVDVGQLLRFASLFPYGGLFACGGLFFLVFDSGWTPSRAIGIAVGFVLSAYHGVQTMSGFIDGPHISPVAQATTVAIVFSAFVAFAMLKRSPATGRYASVAALAGGLTYPLYLLHNTGRELFLNQPVPGPRWLHILLGILFSIVISWAVMRAAAAFVKPPLRRAIDATLARLSLK